MGYLLDSNVLIDYVANRFSDTQLFALDAILDEALHISVVTKIEVLGFRGNPGEDAQMAEFITFADVISLSDEIVDRTIALRKDHKIKIPDAIIAATAMTFDLSVLTNNTADFSRINGIKLLNPNKDL